MSELLQGWKRTCYCTELGKADVGREVTLMGWCNVRRDLGALIFVQLRDRSGLMQVVFDSSTLSAEDYDRASTIRSEYVLAVRGTLEARTGNMVNPKMKTGEVEVKVRDFKILSVSETPPFEVSDDTNAGELLRLKYRYLDLRRPVMQQNLMMRHKIAHITREYFAENGFVEIETPVLTGSTPEGARDYLVPSRVHPGSFYALPQSPQLFKQMLMVSGFDRYMQIARCFRDEDLRADRQPDFTQIDLEMSFVEEDDVMAMNEGFLRRVFKECLDVDIPNPLPRIKWIDAMNRYGSDKPDVRFGMELVDLTDIVKNSGFSVFANAVKNGGSVRCINVKGGSHHYSRKEIDAEGEFVKTYKAKGLAWMNYKDEGIQSPILKFLSAEEVAAIEEKANFEKGDLLSPDPREHLRPSVGGGVPPVRMERGGGPVHGHAPSLYQPHGRGPGPHRKGPRRGPGQGLRHRAQRQRDRRRQHPYPFGGAAEAHVQGPGLHRGGGPAALRLPAQRLQVRHAAPRGPGLRSRQAGHADLRRGQHPGRDRLPQGAERLRPPDRRALPRGAEAAGRAAYLVQGPGRLIEKRRDTMANENVIHIGSEEAFDKLMAGDAPVLVDFWATWCGPCRMIAPIVEEIANEYAGKVVVAKVDVDEMGELAQRYRIMNIPTLMLFKQGQLVDKAIGARPKAALEQMLNKAL